MGFLFEILQQFQKKRVIRVRALPQEHNEQGGGRDGAEPEFNCIRYGEQDHLAVSAHAFTMNR